MALCANQFTEDLVKLFDHLLRLRLTSLLNEWVVNDSIKKHKKILVERTVQRKRDKPLLYLGSALLVPDYESAAPWVKRHAYSSRRATDEGLLELAGEVSNRLHGEVICSAFEAMETYFKRVGAKAFFHARNANTSRKVSLRFLKSEFHAVQKKWQLKGSRSQEGTPVYFAAYVRWCCRAGCSELLWEFHRTLPPFRTNERKAHVLDCLIGFYEAVEFCRHRMVHVAGQYDRNQLKKLNKGQKEFVEAITKHSKLSEAEVLLPTHETVSTVLGDFAGLAHLVYGALSDTFDMKDDYSDLVVKRKKRR